MSEEKKVDTIDLRVVYHKLVNRKKFFYKTWIITFVVACALILCVPRYYVVEMKLAPELGGTSTGGTLSSMLSSFGVDLGGMESSDAISPLIYPDLFSSSDFISSLFDIEVEKLDGSVKTDYYTYMMKYQETTLFKIPLIWARRQIKKIFPKKEYRGGTGEGGINPFMMTEEEEMLVEGIKSKITCGVDKKTVVITIKVEDQDPLICATMADSVSKRLRDFITDYRTNKARVDYEFYKKMAKEAKAEYEEAIRRYSEYVDGNKNAVLQSFISNRDRLENEMSMKYTTYTAMNTQLEAAKAKVQERTPVFTVIQGATVPNKPAGPKRMLFVIGMLFVATFFAATYIMKDDVLSQLKAKH